MRAAVLARDTGSLIPKTPTDVLMACARQGKSGGGCIWRAATFAGHESACRWVYHHCLGLRKNLGYVQAAAQTGARSGAFDVL